MDNNEKTFSRLQKHAILGIFHVYSTGSSDPTCLPACLLGFPYVWFWDEKLKNRKSLDGSEDTKYIVGSRTHCFLSDISAVAANRDIQGHTSKSAKHNRSVFPLLSFLYHTVFSWKYKRESMRFNANNINLVRPPLHLSWRKLVPRYSFGH